MVILGVRVFSYERGTPVCFTSIVFAGGVRTVRRGGAVPLEHGDQHGPRHRREGRPLPGNPSTYTLHPKSGRLPRPERFAKFDLGIQPRFKSLRSSCTGLYQIKPRVG